VAARPRPASLGTAPTKSLKREGRTPLRIIWEQLTATMVLILIAAAFVAALLGDTQKRSRRLAIIVLYTVLGLSRNTGPKKPSPRSSGCQPPTYAWYVMGRLLNFLPGCSYPAIFCLLEAGNIVPADVRLVEAVNLNIQEAALTGESEPVEKQTRALQGADLPLGDRRNLAFMGTIVTQGRGRALVTATGMQTELGRIAALLQQSGTEQTPLQRRLDRLGKQLAGIGVVIAALVFGLGLWRGDDIRHMLLTAVSVAVAIVPEGLPAVVTITLAIGAQRMLAHNALIRKLPAVETLAQSL